MSQQALTATPAVTSHYHIWRVALTGKAAFMSRPYLKRDAATQAARRWATDAAPGGWSRSASPRRELPAAAEDRQRSLTGSDNHPDGQLR